MSRIRQILKLIGITALMASAVAPHRTIFAQRLEFEVASVRANTDNGPGNPGGVPSRSGDLIRFHNAQVFTVIFYAYHLTGSYQVIGFKDISDQWRWVDIEARAGANATEDQIRRMFQSLLEDRFKLKAHRETRELPVYELGIGRGKPKLSTASDTTLTVTIEGRTVLTGVGRCSTSLWREGNHIICHAVSLDQITSQLSGLLQAPVIDRTGLAGMYDLDVLYLPDNRKLEADAPPVPSLVDAVQETLGLKLEKSKGPVEVLVIDHIEKPSAN